MGVAHLGVPRAGALDPEAARLANRLVGNPDEAAVLETTLTGVALRAAASVTVAVTGAFAAVSVAGQRAGWGVPVTVGAGEVVDVGPASTGVRSYLAVGGGIVVPPVLGSRSRDTLSGVGPAPLCNGDDLPVGAALPAPSGPDAELPNAELPNAAPGAPVDGPARRGAPDGIRTSDPRTGPAADDHRSPRELVRRSRPGRSPRRALRRVPAEQPRRCAPGRNSRTAAARSRTRKRGNGARCYPGAPGGPSCCWPTTRRPAATR